MKKKQIVYGVHDRHADVTLIQLGIEELKDYIEISVENLDDREDWELTITPLVMTEEEIENLPEHD